MSEKNIESQEIESKNIIEPIERDIKGVIGKCVTIFAVLMSVFHLYTAFFGTFVSILQRSAHLGFALALTFAVIKPSRKKESHVITWTDYILILLSILSFGYLVLNAHEIVRRYHFVEPLSVIQMTVGIVATILLIEATRRTVGLSLAIIVMVSLAYAAWGNYLTGIIGHSEIPIKQIVEQLFYTTSGVFGIPIGVSATYIFMFILFGKFLEKTGAGQFFIDLAVAGMGKYRGGPAKTAIGASSALGMITGSTVANTVTVGSFTIPLMKKTGYQKEFAGAVEAVSGTGGQIMPPIMGASAFIIASFLGVPYIQVAIAAIIPALLYYICLFFQVDFRAVRTGLKGIPKSELPSFKKVFKQGFLFFLPLVLIVYLLFTGYSPMRAGLMAIVSLFVIVTLKSSTRINFSKLIRILDEGAKGVLEVAIACGAAGVVVGMISLTGLGLKFSGIIIDLAGGSLLVTLIFTAISCIILGIGLPTVAAYIVQVALTVPALVQLGVEPLAAHLFIFYFAITSPITPPVALAAYAAAGIAKANPMRTGVIAFRLGIGVFIIPFMFVYGPELLLMGSPMKIALSVITAIIGIYGVAAGAEGWLKRNMNWWERIVILLSSIILIAPGIVAGIIGFVGILFIFLLHHFGSHKDSSTNVVKSG